MPTRPCTLFFIALLYACDWVQAYTVGHVAYDRRDDISCLMCEFNDGLCQYDQDIVTCLCNAGYILKTEWTCARDNGLTIPWQPAEPLSDSDSDTSILSASETSILQSSPSVSLPLESIQSSAPSLPSIAPLTTTVALPNTTQTTMIASPSSTPSSTMSASPSSTPSSTMSASPSSTPSSTMSASASSTSSSTMSTSPSSTPSSTLVASPSSTASIPPSLEPSSSPAASQSPRPSISPTATSTVLGPLEPTSQCRRPPQGKPVYHIRSYYHRFCTSRKNGNYYPEIDQDCSEQENKFIWHPGHWNRFVLLNENLGLTDHCISVSDYETFKATYPLFTGPTDDSTMQDLIPGECEGEYVKWGTTDHPTLPIEDEVVKIVSVDLEFNGEPVCLAARPVTMPEDQYYIAECDHDNPDIWWKFERLCDIDADYDLSITPE